jgi:hypothetical protein
MAYRKTHLVGGCKTADRNGLGFVAETFWNFVQLPDSERCSRCDNCKMMKFEIARTQKLSEEWEPETGAAADVWRFEEFGSSIIRPSK